MTKDGYYAEALVKLIDEVVKKNGLIPCQKGVAKYGKSKEGTWIIGDRYLEERYRNYQDGLKENPSLIVSPRKDYFDVIAKEAGFKNLEDFLTKNGFPTKKIESPSRLESKDHLSKGNPPHANEWIDKYIVGARIMPAFLGVFPLFITLFFVAVENKDWSNSTLAFAFFIGLGLTLGLAGWLSIFGKRWESKLFFHDGKKGFPTTYMMLFSTPGRYSEARKVAYRQKISAYFGIPFPSKEEELANEREAIQKLNEAGVRVKNTVKSVVIRSALTRYGFQRNLVPASLLATVLAIPCMALGIWKNNVPLMGAMALCLAAGAYYSLRYPKWLKAASEAYARYLIDDFLSR